MKKLYFLMTMLCISYIASAQNSEQIFKVSGVVIDSVSQESIPYTTISVYKLPDNKVVKRLAADMNGKFKFELSKTGTYKIQISSIGFSDYNKKLIIKNDKTEYKLGAMKVKEATTELGTVEVVAQKRLVKVEADKIIYNTEADPDSKTSTALDMMRRVPLLTVDGDDNIQLKGSSNFKIYMNGKPSTLMAKNPSEILKSMPGSSIKNIEVITSPGAKYDAEGTGGIINIITTKQVLKGYSGSVNLGFDNLGRTNGSTMFSAALGKFIFSINVGGSHRSGEKSHSNTQQEFYNNELLHNLNTFSEGTNDGFYQWGNFNFSYEMDTLNLITGSFDFWHGKGGNNSNSKSEVFNINNNLIQSYTNSNQIEYLFGSTEGSLNYQRTAKHNKEQFLTISYKLDHSPHEMNNDLIITPILDFYDKNEKIRSDEHNTEQTFQLDYVQPIKNAGKFEIGSKYIMRRSSVITTEQLLDFETNSYYENVNENVDLAYTQDIFAGYVSFNGKLGKLGYKAGIRVEDSETKGMFKSDNGTDFNSHSLEYVPSASLSYQLGKMNSLQFAYAKRIQRPSIWYLNPYIDNSDPQYINFGNPELDPEHFHSFDLNYNMFLGKGNINLSSFYSFSNNGIDNITWIGENEVLYRTYKNISKQQNYGGSANINMNFGKSINFSTNFSTRFTEVENIEDATQNNSGWSHGGYGRFQLNFAKTFKLSSYGGLWSPRVRLQGSSSSFYYYGLSLTKYFFDKKLSFSIAARDFFEEERKFSYETFDDDFYRKSEYYRPSRSFSFSIYFRFGEMKTRVKRTKRTIQNTDVKEGGGNEGNQGGQ